MRSTTNGLKTALLLGLLSAILVVAGGAVAGQTGVIIGLLLAVGINAYSYFNSATIALRTMGAEPVSEQQAPQLWQSKVALYESDNVMAGSSGKAILMRA